LCWFRSCLGHVELQMRFFQVQAWLSQRRAKSCRRFGSRSPSLSIFCLLTRLYISRACSTWRDTRCYARGARQPTRKQRWRVASHLRPPAFNLDEEGSVAHWQPLDAVRRIFTSSRHDELRLLSSYHSLLLLARRPARSLRASLRSSQAHRLSPIVFALC